MAHIIKFINKETGEEESIPVVDGKMREYFKAEKAGESGGGYKTFAGWRESIGMGLAMGLSFDQIHSWFEPDSIAHNIIEYIRKYYKVNTYRA